MTICFIRGSPKNLIHFAEKFDTVKAMLASTEKLALLGKAPIYKPYHIFSSLPKI